MSRRSWQGNVQESMIHVQSCCFANPKLLFFFVLVAVAAKTRGTQRQFSPKYIETSF